MGFFAQYLYLLLISLAFIFMLFNYWFVAIMLLIYLYSFYLFIVNNPGGFTPLYRLNVCVAGYPPKFWTFGENISDFLVKIKKYAICFVFLRKNWKKNGKNWKKLNNYITNLIKIDKLWNNFYLKVHKNWTKNQYISQQNWFFVVVDADNGVLTISELPLS